MKKIEITPDLIPHSEFHTGIWLLSAERPDWYYFMKKKNSNIVRNKSFIKSVDRPLRGLVKFLHKRGIKTTPSCSGHHISERNLEKIYEALEKDKDDIVRAGLLLKDVETGKEYFFQDRNYVLPWTKQEFIDSVSIYQQKGVIGLRLGNRKKLKDRILKLKIDNVTVEERDSIIFIFADGEHKGNNRRTWKKITKEIKSLAATPKARTVFPFQKLPKSFFAAVASHNNN